MAKHALTVGINDYPGTDMDLAGCVNDAHDWRDLLQSRHFVVTSLYNQEATRARLIEALAELIGGADEGDTLVFHFSGHGSWLPDQSHDEPDERDEMLCPYDVMDDQFLMDDDLYGLFCAKTEGVRLFVIADCCHSGSVVRLVRPDADAAVYVKPRFLPPEVFIRGDVTLERAIDKTKRKPAPMKARYPAVLLSGCRDTEFSYDTAFNGRPNGAFTRTAIDAFVSGRVASPKAWHAAVRAKLPTSLTPQTPQLYGSEADLDGPLF